MTRVIRLLVGTSALFGAALAVATVLALIQVTTRGVSTQVAPTTAEVVVARAVRDLSVPRGSRLASNPLARSPEALAEGRRHYADHCAICHANDGGGDTALGRSMYPRPPDLRAAATQRLTDGEIFYFIEHGIRLTGMPGFGDGSREGQESSWRLVHFIRHLPSLSPNELVEMRTLNPKTAEEWRAEDEERAFLAGADIASLTHER